MVLDFIFRSLIHFELVFVNDMRQRSNFLFLHVNIQLSQHYLLKKLLFSHWIVQEPLSKINSLQMYAFISGLSILFHQLFVCPYASTNHSFVVTFDIGVCDSSKILFLFQIILAIWGPQQFHMNLRINFSIYAQKALGFFVRISLNLQIAFSDVAILILFHSGTQVVFPFTQVFFSPFF